MVEPYTPPVFGTRLEAEYQRQASLCYHTAGDEQDTLHDDSLSRTASETGRVCNQRV